MSESAPPTRVILQGIDTLELHTQAPLAPHFLAELEALKAAAQRTPLGEALPTWRCAGLAFTVSPRASQRGQYLLEADGAMAVSVNPYAPKGLPTVSLELRALRLWQHGADNAAAEAEEVAGVLTLGEHPDIQVSRIDVTCDWQGWQPGVEDLPRFTSRARDDSSHRVLRHFTGWTFGRSAVRARIYDKTAEIVGTDKADWMPLRWAQHPAYDEGQAVWRLEGQVRREALRELQGKVPEADALFKRWSDCRKGLASLWDYLWGEWLSLRLPRTGRQRRRLDPRWASLVSQADWHEWDDVASSVPLARVAAEARFRRTLDQLCAYLARGIAERWALQGFRADVERTAWQLLHEASMHSPKQRHGLSLKERADQLFAPMKEQLDAEDERRKDRLAKGLDDAEARAWAAWHASRDPHLVPS